MRDIKYRLIRDGKVVGYEKHSPIIDDANNFGIQIWHNSCNVAGNPRAFDPQGQWIPHDSKDEYTSLKDKNGVEGYHKDILIDSLGRYLTIEWDDSLARFYIRPQFTGVWVQSMDYLVEYEIVSNRFENPELEEVK